MAANLRAKPTGFTLQTETNQRPDVPARFDVARLAALHAEAEETARLANVLGRAPSAAAALAAAAGLTAALARGGADVTETIAWLVLMLIGVGALARAYSQAIRAPFELAPLRAFSEDLRAIMLYAGFAWGAGAFLALPAASGIATTLLYAGGMSGLVALALRRPETALCFVVPVAVLSAFAALIRPLDGGFLTALLVLAVCAGVAGAVLAAGRLSARFRALPQLGRLQAG